jgi:hypothetical protein
LTNNNILGRYFTFGYGLSYSRNIWRRRYKGEIYSQNKDFDYYDKALGFMFNAYFTYGKFRIGLIYRPDIITMSPSFKFGYKHMLSLDVGWKIRLHTVGMK